MNEEMVTDWVRAELAELLSRSVDEIDPARTFAQLGIDSASATLLLIALEDRLQIELDPDVVLALPTINSLSAYAVSLIGDRSSNS